MSNAVSQAANNTRNFFTTGGSDLQSFGQNIGSNVQSAYQSAVGNLQDDFHGWLTANGDQMYNTYSARVRQDVSAAIQPYRIWRIILTVVLAVILVIALISFFYIIGSSKKTCLLVGQQG